MTVTNDARFPVTYDLSGVTTVGTGPSTNPAAVFPFNFAFLRGDNLASAPRRRASRAGWEALPSS